ncbi:hypothetical protein QE152_g28344 [Popillia japonica]|uniref:Uncharacterized protein n=1 Tax=Popillia japonica TaxID=7064 RepID=A0AAW1JKJ9_POPJA
MSTAPQAHYKSSPQITPGSMKNAAFNQTPTRNPLPIKPNFPPTSQVQPNQFQNLYRPPAIQTSQFQTNQFRNNMPRPDYFQHQRQPQPHVKPSSFKFAKTPAQQLEKRQPRQQPMDIDPSFSRIRQQTPFGPAASRNRFHVEELHQQEEEDAEEFEEANYEYQLVWDEDTEPFAWEPEEEPNFPIGASPPEEPPSILKTKFTEIPLHFDDPSTKLGSRERRIVKLPVDRNLQEVYIAHQAIAPGVEIPENLTTTQDYEAITEVANCNNYPVELRVQLPIKIEPYGATEENHHSAKLTPKQIEKIQRQNVEQKLRLEHLDEKERIMIKKLCLEYKDICHDERLPLTFTSTIKHQIRLKEDIPSYQKQNIIQDSSSPWSAPVAIVPKKMDGMQAALENFEW